VSSGGSGAALTPLLLFSTVQQPAPSGYTNAAASSEPFGMSAVTVKQGGHEADADAPAAAAAASPCSACAEGLHVVIVAGPTVLPGLVAATTLPAVAHMHVIFSAVYFPHAHP
jgi:hypothetical protein